MHKIILNLTLFTKKQILNMRRIYSKSTVFIFWFASSSTLGASLRPPLKEIITVFSTSKVMLRRPPCVLKSFSLCKKNDF